MDIDLETKLDRLRSDISALGRVAVAFSAGVDSTFVLSVAADVLGRDHVLAVTGRSESVQPHALGEAKAIAADFGVEHIFVDTDEFSDERYLSNPYNRCYFCKTALFSAMTPLVRQRSLNAILTGTNADDLGDWRPGLKAADEWGVRAPAAEAGLSKADVRALSRRMGIPTADKPANPCLSSRIPYGEAVTPEKLRMIDAAEGVLHRLGFPVCRVRHHGQLARIEVPSDQVERCLEDEVRDEIERSLKEIGFDFVTVDLRGFRSGSLNEVIAFGTRQSGR